MIGSSPQMQAVFARAHQFARSSAPVLLTGESGTGKELVARLIHNHSQWSHQPFIAVNCGGIPEELAESELFGHEKGAFTGAFKARQGRFRAAQQGTLFLDEIGEMSQKLQVKILRVLQDHQVEPVGSDTAIYTKARIIAATNKDLWTQVKRRRFREDLYYRLNVLPLHLSPLRERQGDVALLIDYFLGRQNLRRHKPVKIDIEAFLALTRHTWPGNVRELENIIERLVVLNESGAIGVEDVTAVLPVAVAIAAPGVVDLTSMTLPLEGLHLMTILDEIADNLIHQAIIRTGGNRSAAAGMLHLKRTTLLARLNRHRRPTPQLERRAA